MEPEGGVTLIYGTAEVEVLPFTSFGVENLIEIIAMENRRQT